MNRMGKQEAIYKWLKWIGGAFTTMILVLAGLAAISGYNLRELLHRNETVVEGKSEAEAVTDNSPVSQPPKETLPAKDSKPDIEIVPTADSVVSPPPVIPEEAKDPYQGLDPTEREIREAEDRFRKRHGL